MTHRIKIIGCPGAGKTTLAAELARRHGLVHIELDAHFHMADWEPRPRIEFQNAVQDQIDAAQTRGWVIDGNYRSKLQGIGDQADTIVWLDLPRSLIMRRILARSVGRALTCRELWNGNRERLRNLVSGDPHQNIVLWAWVQHPVYQAQYADNFRTIWSDRETYRLRTPREVRRFLATFGSD